jgi:allantoinase
MSLPTLGTAPMHDLNGMTSPGPAQPRHPAEPARDLVIRARRVLTPGGIRPAAVAITGGRISAVWPYAGPGGPAAADPGSAGEPGRAETAATQAAGGVPPGPAAGQMAAGTAVVDLADDEVLLPGLVDSHVHVNEPGRTSWEGFETATLAAAAGGITTIIDMPLNSIPPTTDPAALAAKRAAADGQCHVDVGFWGGAIPGNGSERGRIHDDGVFGFKCFMVDSGVAEFAPLGDQELAEAARQAALLDALLIVHAEDPESLRRARELHKPGGADYVSFLRSRPPVAENRAIAKLLTIARGSGARVHILHLSSAEALPEIEAARDDGVQVTAETCPHYLALTAEEVPDGATEFKCCPPIRERGNQDRLWAALGAGTIDCVVSDHSPCPPELKRLAGGDFAAAWGGISSLQLTLPVVWTQARARGFTLDDVVGWMSARPARIAGVAGKGAIEPGGDADLVAFAPDETFTVDPARLYHRHKLTPYAGQQLHGVVRRAWLRGQPLAAAAAQGAPVPAGAAAGRLLTRTHAAPTPTQDGSL